MKQNDAKMMKIDIVNFGEKIQKAVVITIIWYEFCDYSRLNPF